MKAKFILSILFILSMYGVRAQKVDTIYVNHASTVYIVFPGDIGLVDIGSKKYLHNLQDGAKNVLFLKADAKSSADPKGYQPSSLFVKYGEEFYSGVIVYKEKLSQNMYDFRKSVTTTNVVKNNGTNPTNNGGGNTNKSSTTEQKNQNTETSFQGDDLSRKILILRDKKQEPKSLGKIENKLSVFCTNILTDKQFIYLKFSIKNNSSLDYEIDFTEFNFVDKRSKNLEQKEPIKPAFADEKKVFPAKREVDFLYAIPVVAGTDSSFFEVTFRELNGTRKVVIEIPSKKVNQAETIK